MHHLSQSEVGADRHGDMVAPRCDIELGLGLNQTGGRAGGRAGGPTGGRKGRRECSPRSASGHRQGPPALPAKFGPHRGPTKGMTRDAAPSTTSTEPAGPPAFLTVEEAAAVLRIGTDRRVPAGRPLGRHERGRGAAGRALRPVAASAGARTAAARRRCDRTHSPSSHRDAEANDSHRATETDVEQRRAQTPSCRRRPAVALSRVVMTTATDLPLDPPIHRDALAPSVPHPFHAEPSVREAPPC